MNILIVQIIQIVCNLLILLIIINSVLSFFMAPYHPVRETIGRVLNPLYAPLRRIIPPLGAIDITPLILILLIQVFESILISILI